MYFLKNKAANITLAIFLLINFTSCIKYKNLSYLQSKEDSSLIKKCIYFNRTAYRIKSGDNLDIKFSSADPQTSAILNKETGIRPPTSVNSASLYVQSYSVNDSGFVNLPMIGIIKVKNLTIQELTDTLLLKLDDLLTLKNVVVKISNFRVSILGEVKTPGTQFIYSDNITIFQALGLAGDLTELGNRRNIKIIRNNTENTGALVAYMDITDPECLSSEYYFLKPDDVIYISPVRLRATKSNLSIYQAAIATITAIYLIFKLIQLK